MFPAEKLFPAKRDLLFVGLVCARAVWALAVFGSARGALGLGLGPEEVEVKGCRPHPSHLQMPG